MEAGKGWSSKRATWEFPDAADRRDFDLHRPDEQPSWKFMWKNTRKGHDTTAATMNFAVRYIGENAAVLAQLRNEHEEVLKGKLAGERLTWDDCKSMTFTNDVITETLHLCNISSSVSRKSLEDVHVGGQVIPKGWHVMPYFKTIHHDPAIYQDPWRFNPWRSQIHSPKLLIEARVNGTKLPFFGFGGGPRLCPGSELARVEMCLFIHHLITKFK